MSGRNHYRAAIACSKVTGTSYGRCVDLEKRGLISLHQPVPDADTAAQRSFEALVVNVLANAFTNRQVGAALGIDRVFPTATHVTLGPHTAMARRVLWELLPRYDSYYGGVRGVPGLRIEQQPGRVVLLDLLSQARVFVVPAIDPRSLLHNLVPFEQPLWLSSNAELHCSEARDRTYWSADGTSRQIREKAARDWLLCRILRRPVLINKTCREHGWANIYTHGYEDLVIEWCCGDTQADLARQFRHAGTFVWPGDPDLGPCRPPSTSGPEVLWLGHSRVTLRRSRNCSGPSFFVRTSVSTEWYR